MCRCLPQRSPAVPLRRPPLVAPRGDARPCLAGRPHGAGGPCNNTPQAWCVRAGAACDAAVRGAECLSPREASAAGEILCGCGASAPPGRLVTRSTVGSRPLQLSQHFARCTPRADRPLKVVITRYPPLLPWPASPTPRPVTRPWERRSSRPRCAGAPRGRLRPGGFPCRPAAPNRTPPPVPASPGPQCAQCHTVEKGAGHKQVIGSAGRDVLRPPAPDARP